MIYKELGRTGLRISRLGFGAMRLPSRDGKTDVEESIRMFHRAFELGITYVDTAVIYCGGESENIIGEALQQWPDRDRIVVSTKNHYMGNDEKAWWTNLENSLRKLQRDRIDVYNVHAISWEKWEKWVRGPGGILSWMKKARDQGLIDHICCSFHDTPEALRKIAETGEFESITLQYNMLYRDLEPVFPFLAENGIGIVVMGPVAGGRLQEPSESLRGIVGEAASTPEVALRFVLSNPHVTAAISGMSTMEQIEENCATVSRDEPLTPDEHRRIAEALDRIKHLADLYCTGCNYCMPCPSGVDIPGNFLAMNYARAYGLENEARRQYERLNASAISCVACGTCEPKCPQNIPIRQQLREVAARFDPAYGTMALALQPVRRENGALKVQVIAHNLSDQPATAEISLRASPGSPDSVEIRPDAMTLEIRQPFVARGKPVRVEWPEGEADRLELTTHVRDAAGERDENFACALARCGDGAEAVRWKGPGRIFVREDPSDPLADAAAHPFHDDEGIGVKIVLPGDRPRVTAHILLDLRKRTGLLAPGFHEGMFAVRLFPGEDGAERPGVKVEKGALEASALPVSGSRLDGTVEWLLRIPWESLGIDRPDPGRVVGFDLLLEERDEDGRHRFRAGWNGNPRVLRDGRMGCLILD